MFIIECGRKHFSERIKSAFRRNDKKSVIIILGGDNPSEIRDHEGSTLLHLAIKENNCKIIDFLVNIGCDVNAQNQMGTTPILAAFEAYHFPLMRRLLQAKANIFISDNKGINVLKAILNFDEDRNRENYIEFFIESIRECGLNAQELASIMIEARWPIHYAVYIENPEVIKFMLEAGCDIDSRDKGTDYLTALHRAIFNSDVKTTKILLEYGADIDIIHEDLDSPFEIATTYHPFTSFDIFETFLKHKPTMERFNTDGAIQSYASFANADGHIIRLLFNYKVSLTTKDKCGVTLLHNLVLNRDREVINLIMESEIDVNIKDIYGNTPLHCTVRLSNIECIKALISKGADINAKNLNGQTPLTNAIKYHAKQEEIETLVENNTILDEEMQNILLNVIVVTNIPLSNVSSIFKRMAVMHLQLEGFSRRNLELIQNNSNINLLFESYLRELNSMEQKKIIDHSHISVLDILCASEQKLLNLARNKKMVDNFLEIDVKSKYLIFGELVKMRFESACSKQNLVQNAINVLMQNIKQLNFNLEVTENIVKCLSIDDLSSFHVNGCF